MAHPTGAVTLQANGKDYTLWLGMSVLADVQAKFGHEFDAMLSGLDRDTGEMPNLSIVHALFTGALRRFHADEVDRYLVDDIIVQNPNALASLLMASTPSPDGQPGKRKAAA
jgi:hypothetical protein